MNGDELAVVKSWFKKADNDLRAAEHLITINDAPCDTVCFHAQQCAEKYLKGFLAYHKVDFPKTHSLEDLAMRCKNAEPAIESGFEELEILSSYAVAVRYPDDIYYDIPEDDAREAIELARMVRGIILKCLEGKI